ncbi:unnamed protein product [Fusarium graminearum]|uniref:Chromosome 2, complete genome n=1 Tax=Gibberella zeae (strain ATCC MYA-4620 / CBS 123657 / FGSC 9075 / NRRL 31084 / PH-1) TaxID=229533 RepID=A0A098DDZ7_GIBZE|nr:unnamed protein product [Fusarium graminearum]CZS80445.1 unnamed protein product [Fusarium graminearum]
MATNGNKVTICTSPQCHLLKLCCDEEFDSGPGLACVSARPSSTARGRAEAAGHALSLCQLLTQIH